MIASISSSFESNSEARKFLPSLNRPVSVWWWRHLIWLMWSHKKVNFVHTKHAWGKHTVCLCILDNSLEAIFLSIFPEFSEPTGNQGEADRKTLTGLHGQVPSHPHMRRPYMHHQPVLQQTSNLLNNKKSFQHFQSALTTGFIIGKRITIRQTEEAICYANRIWNHTGQCSFKHAPTPTW